MTISFQPVVLATEDKDEGLLVFGDGRLAAVLSRLSALHQEQAGLWFLECGFGDLSNGGETFPDIEAAKAWIIARLDS